FRVQVPQGVIAEAREMHDGIESPQVLCLNISHVDRKRRQCRRRVAEEAFLVEKAVEANDVVPRLLQHRHEGAADVAVVPGYEYLHANRESLIGFTSRPSKV